MTFRREDHQALQDMFHFRIRVDPAVAWGIPELVRVLPAADAPDAPLVVLGDTDVRTGSSHRVDLPAGYDHFSG